MAVKVPRAPRDKAQAPGPAGETGHLLTLEMMGWPLAKLDLGCGMYVDNNTGALCQENVFPVLS